MAVIPLLPNGRTVLMPGADVQRLPRHQLFRWCAKTARYGLVTRELVTWLRKFIGDRRAIEIGAGVGDLGFHLGIPMTDSYVQHAYKAVYDRAGHAITTKQPDIEQMEALAAVERFKPDVVVASWVTQLYDASGPDDSMVQSFVDGIDEIALLARVPTYVFIGNIGQHGKKRILATPHKQYRFPWLQSRSLHPGLNRIWVWGER